MHLRQASVLAVITAVAWSGCAFQAQRRGPPPGRGRQHGRVGPAAELVDRRRKRCDSGGSTPPASACEGLECQQSTCKGGNCVQPACPGGALTTLTGKVYDPAGRVPLYNVDVYVPNGPAGRLSRRSKLRQLCRIVRPANAVVRTTTDASGSFTLGDHGADVPAGSNIPLVFQIGKWRRQITIPTVTACTQTALTDPNQTRLPRDQSEGHIPKMALTTGQNDALECLLRKVGIADSEFTPETGNGRINFYAGGGGTSAYASTLNGGRGVHARAPVVGQPRQPQEVRHRPALVRGAESGPSTRTASPCPQEHGGAAGAGGLRRPGRPGVRVSLARLLVRAGDAGVQVDRDVQSPRRLADDLRRHDRPEHAHDAGAGAVDGERRRLDDAWGGHDPSKRELAHGRRGRGREHLAAMDLRADADAAIRCCI